MLVVNWVRPMVRAVKRLSHPLNSKLYGRQQYMEIFNWTRSHHGSVCIWNIIQLFVMASCCQHTIFFAWSEAPCFATKLFRCLIRLIWLKIIVFWIMWHWSAFSRIIAMWCIYSWLSLKVYMFLCRSKSAAIKKKTCDCFKLRHLLITATPSVKVHSN